MKREKNLLREEGKNKTAPGDLGSKVGLALGIFFKPLVQSEALSVGRLRAEPRAPAPRPHIGVSGTGMCGGRPGRPLIRAWTVASSSLGPWSLMPQAASSKSPAQHLLCQVGAFNSRLELGRCQAVLWSVWGDES